MAQYFMLVVGGRLAAFRDMALSCLAYLQDENCFTWAQFG